VGRELPSHRLRELAIQAAEARLKKQAVMSSGPRTTGEWLLPGLHSAVLVLCVCNVCFPVPPEALGRAFG
jgi:hypothetical protein